MKSYFALSLLFVACSFAQSQVAPAATAGIADLKYALRYSETEEFSDALGTVHAIDTSGSLDYANGRTRRPFHLEYSGGYLSTISGASYGGAYHHLQTSQGFEWRKSFLDFSDDVSYRRQAPITGFSGIPGTGEPIAGGTNPPSDQLILTLNTPVLNNDVLGEFRRIVNHSLSISMNAHQGLLRYLDGNGLDTDQLMIGAGPNFRLDARNSLITQYAFSRFSYSGDDSHFQTNTVNVGYDRTWNRALHSSVSAGPEWVQAAGSIPGSIGVAAQASLRYQARHFSSSLSFDRETNGGSGYFMGARTQSLTADFSRPWGQKFAFEMNGGYRSTSDLASEGSTAGEFGGLEASWEMNRHLSAFASYTAASQSSTGQLPFNVFDGIMQVVSFGVSFSKDLKSAR